MLPSRSEIVTFALPGRSICTPYVSSFTGFGGPTVSESLVLQAESDTTTMATRIFRIAGGVAERADLMQGRSRGSERVTIATWRGSCGLLWARPCADAGALHSILPRV